MQISRNKTIVAVATPQGTGGVGIVRISGEKALEIAKKIFSPQPKIFEPNKMFFGKISATDFVDDGYMVYFQAPRSFTGEDVVEFQAHGGSLVLQKIVEKIVDLGAVPAQAGEFSMRAFLNNKMTLDQAEAMIELINAESTAHLRAVSKLMEGAFAKKVTGLQSELTGILAQIDVSFDYPEHDSETQISQNISTQLQKICEELNNLIATYNQGHMLKNGVSVCILGMPNVGKSSLLNALVGCESAIVTDIPGTTTDVVVDSYTYKGVRFNIMDTAGIREGGNEIEKIGIERAKKTAIDADIVLTVFDNSRKLNKNELEILENIDAKRIILVLNKIDKKLSNEQFDNLKKVHTFIEISASKSQNIDKLKELIYQACSIDSSVSKEIVIANERHYFLLENAKKSLEIALENINNYTLDCISFDISQCWNNLGLIVGNVNVEDIIDSIFSKFCLGK